MLWGHRFLFDDPVTKPIMAIHDRQSGEPGALTV